MAEKSYYAIYDVREEKKPKLVEGCRSIPDDGIECRIIELLAREQTIGAYAMIYERAVGRLRVFVRAKKTLKIERFGIGVTGHLFANGREYYGWSDLLERRPNWTLRAFVASPESSTKKQKQV